MEEWYFSIENIVAALTDSVDPKQYIKRIKSRDLLLRFNWGTICTLVEMKGNDDKRRKITATNIKAVFRIIQ